MEESSWHLVGKGVGRTRDFNFSERLIQYFLIAHGHKVCFVFLWLPVYLYDIFLFFIFWYNIPLLFILMEALKVICHVVFTSIIFLSVKWECNPTLYIQERRGRIKNTLRIMWLCCSTIHFRERWFCPLNYPHEIK